MRGGKRDGSGRKKKGSDKTKPFFRNIPTPKYELFCEIWKQFKNEHLKGNNK